MVQQISDFQCAASFIIDFISILNAEITLVGVNATRRAYYIDSVLDFIVDFSYVTGNPPSNRFSFNSPDGLNARFYRFEPSLPQGSGPVLRLGRLIGSVQPSINTGVLTGEITIHQIGDDPNPDDVTLTPTGERPFWTGGNNGTLKIFNSDGSLFRTSPFGTDIQALRSGATLVTEPDGTRIKIRVAPT